MRPLPQACRWIDSHDGSWLHWFYVCIATVKPHGDAWQTTLFTRHGHLVARCASREQGKRWLERCVRANGSPRRR